MSSFTRNTEDADKAQQWKEFYQSWHEIVGSRDDEAFEERIQRLKDRYSLDHAREVGYIIEIWLDLYKEKLVKVWVDRHLHFGNVVTSRGEGIHELIKIYLNTSQLDLFEAWRSIKLAVLNQLSELQANQAKQQIRTPIELSGTFYITTDSSVRADLVDDSFACAGGSGMFDTASSAYASVTARFAFGDPDSADVKIAREAASTTRFDASTGFARYFGNTNTNKADIEGP
ncbi:hypothetical protein ARSEF4850_004313 [Beauveria asiatica]